MIKPIETVYDGYKFRSRLEARWAVFFKTIGAKYDYEKEGYDLGKLGWYLPDFWLPHYSDEFNDGKTGVFVEVKAGAATQKEFDRAYALADGLTSNIFIFEGSPWDERYQVTQIQFWDLGRIKPIVLRNLKFKFREEVTEIEGFPKHPLIHHSIELENGEERAGGFTCHPFAFGLQEHDLKAALSAASQATFQK